MSLADSPEDNEDVSDCVLVQELIDMNASTPPLYIIRELQVELRQIARAFDMDLIDNCTQAASTYRNGIATVHLCLKATARHFARVILGDYPLARGRKSLHECIHECMHACTFMRLWA